ncbi:conserved Plasmodium protein, unknown function [Plasmodium knowlesi strain H]|uniref:Uncharacterized protein n=3 Tax=Plasmodium knowlesi TaxID=5850 RepID=A0A5K1V2H4_PLAKH|nr:conserved Plasmodium protein, unknown function [Plasmodium knowlesi strain H]OTN68258.1 Uncharacterized protein PKNOH_S03323700 [Plasmodium knowlesi]CAA9987139.1 conserved Plasmodium protein, unknown function [Plasmodium knowlesi strain H]SBO23891.1 conserved Plasmodium protein, unknown function [Plasmodium knowlesi strain H]SBO25730.1 conserved Plasmodium protein, unknown function [Plasmodium knowlesi strain H]VVS76613.1 conserved Plasmodium protein, unknown function [Plasmodium knowlesi s|eukprot:XP_002261761.1 hypothetical protein, conserved in Plasmodium species [Plasmodium knowlesi strain H]
MTAMENLYHEDVVIFFSIEMLQGILELFKHANHFKGGVHKIMSLRNSELVFCSDDCLVRESVKEGQGLQKREEKELGIEGKKLYGKSSQNGQGKKKLSNHLFNEKNVNDEQKIIGDEIAKCLYGNRKSSKGAHKRKLVIDVVIQAILFANKIGLDVYKLNLFLSIILMTMRSIRDNLSEKKGRKKKTINYFFHMMNKNIQYAWIAHPRAQSDFIRNVAQQEGCTYDEDESHSMNSNNMGRLSNEIPRKEGKHTTSTKQPISINIKQKPEEETDNQNGMSTNELEKKEMDHNKEDESKDSIPLEGDEQKRVYAQFILFHIEEAKNIIKYFFENIFSIYNMIEYLFLFSPVCVHVAYRGGFSPVSPPACLFTSDALNLGEVANTNDGQMMNHFHGAEHEELATNIYIKEALDVPLFVLNKFYENVDQLGRKIDEVLV